MNADAEKLIKIVESRKNYTSMKHDDLKELYIKVFGHNDPENIEFLNNVDLYIVSYGLGIALGHNPGLDLNEIGIARFENWLMFTKTIPSKKSGANILSIDESPDVMFKKDDVIGQFTPESIKPVYPTVTVINSIDDEKTTDNRTQAVQRMMKKTRTNGSNSKGRTRICKSGLRVAFNKYIDAKTQCENEMEACTSSVNTSGDVIIKKDKILQLSKMKIVRDSALAGVQEVINQIEQTHRKYKLQQIEDSIIESAEHEVDPDEYEEAGPGSQDERLDRKSVPDYPLLDAQMLEWLNGNKHIPVDGNIEPQENDDVFCPVPVLIEEHRQRQEIDIPLPGEEGNKKEERAGKNEKLPGLRALIQHHRHNRGNPEGR